MFRFAHLADIHLGANRHPTLKALEVHAFNRAIDECIKAPVDFMIICGDLFHTGIPDMSTVKNCVRQLREVQNHGIPVYVIYGSHDYNPNTDSMIDILESAELIKNVVCIKDESSEKIDLEFVVDEKTGAKLVGINARKSGLEHEYYERLDNVSLEEESGFKIFCMHSGLTEFKPAHLEFMDTVPITLFPKGFDYYAGGHIHQRIEESLPDYAHVVFPGPIFNGHQGDLEQTAWGEKRGFYIVSVDDSELTLEFIELFGPEAVEYLEIDVAAQNSVEASKAVEERVRVLDAADKIILLKIKGELAGGKTSEINSVYFKSILIDNGALFVRVNKRGLSSREYDSAKVIGEDIPTIESKLLRENIDIVEVSIDSLKSEKGVKTAKALLGVLRIGIKTDEATRDYSARIIDEALESLGLQEMLS